MVSPTQILWDALRAAYDSASEIIISNILWFLLSIPIVTAPAAAAGAYSNAYRLAIGKPATAQSFMKGIRKFGWAGYRFFFMNLLVFLALFFYLYFFGQIRTQWAVWVQGIVIGISIIWLLLNIFTFPLYLAQEEKKLLVALRNSVVFYIKMPGLCLSLISFLLLFLALSTLLGVPWLLFTTVLAFMLCCRFTIFMLSKLGYHPEEENFLHVDAN
jgi:hypothetical protein